MQPELRARIKRSMLHQTGELGYRAVSVRDVCEDFGGYREQFFRLFTDKAECFAAAYEDEIELLCQEMLALIETEQSMERRVEAALGSLAKLVVTDPALAKALFIEVHVAGGSAFAKRQEVVERLSRGIDRACREDPHHSRPPMTAEFVIGIVDRAIASALTRRAPEELEAAVPELSVILSEILRLKPQ